MLQPLRASSSDSTRGQRALVGWATVLLVAGVVLSYRNSGAGPFVFDDYPAIQTNLSIRQLADPLAVLLPPNDSGTTVNGRPLVNLSLALNYAFGGLNVAGYHGVDGLIHLAATWVLFGLAGRLVQAGDGPRRSEREAIVGGAAIAGVWALHPMQTQAVTYVVQRAESLVGLWILVTLYCFCRAQTARRPVYWLAGSVLACFLGVASKEVIVAAPLLVWLCDRGFYAQGFRAAWARRRIYYAALFASWLPLAALIAHSGGRGGTVGFTVAGVNTWSYLLTQADAITRYLGTALWPQKLVFDYGVGVAADLASVGWQAGLVLGLLGATVYGLVRWPRLGFLGAWFFLILAPSSSFVPIITETMAEHRMYLPLAALVALAVVGGLSLPPRVGLATVGVVSVVLGTLTFQRNRDYESAQSLWESSVRNYPASARAQNNLGEIFARARRFDDAVARFQEALRIQPTYLDALCNLSGTLSQIGRAEEALILMEGLAKAHPREAAVQVTYGGVLYRLGRTGEAEQQFRRTLEIAPVNLDALNNLGVALYERNLAEEAMPYFRRALELFPDDASSLFNYANALAKLGKLREAEESHRQALRVEPGRYEAHNNLGALYAQRGLMREATEHFRQAVELSPHYADALNNLGVMLVEAGQLAEAVPLFERALKVRPDYPDAQANLRRTQEKLLRAGTR